MPMRLCPAQGCPKLLGPGERTCPEHAYLVPPPPNDGRPTPSGRGYDYDWQIFRKWFLARHPVCERCRRKSAVDVHHKITLKSGGRRLDEKNCEALCHSCHSRVTAGSKFAARGPKTSVFSGSGFKIRGLR